MGVLVQPYIVAMRAYLGVVSVGDEDGGGDSAFLVFSSHCMEDTYMALADATPGGAAGDWFDVTLLVDRPADTLHYYVDGAHVASHVNASCFMGAFYADLATAGAMLYASTSGLGGDVRIDNVYVGTVPAAERADSDVTVHVFVDSDDDGACAACGGAAGLDDGNVCTVDACVPGVPRYAYDTLEAYVSDDYYEDETPRAYAACNQPPRATGDNGWAPWLLGGGEAASDSLCEEDPLEIGDMWVDLTGGADGGHALRHDTDNVAVVMLARTLYSDYVYASTLVRVDAAYPGIGVFSLRNSLVLYDDRAYVVVQSNGNGVPLTLYAWAGFCQDVLVLSLADVAPAAALGGDWFTLALLMDVPSDAVHFFVDGARVAVISNVSCGAEAGDPLFGVMVYAENSNVTGDIRFDDVYFGNVPLAERGSDAGVALHVLTTDEGCVASPCAAANDGDACTTDSCLYGAPRSVYDALEGYPAPASDAPEDRVYVVCHDPSGGLRWVSPVGERGGCVPGSDMWVDPAGDDEAGVLDAAALHVDGDEGRLVMMDGGAALGNGGAGAVPDYVYASLRLRVDTARNSHAYVQLFSGISVEAGGNVAGVRVYNDAVHFFAGCLTAPLPPLHAYRSSAWLRLGMLMDVAGDTVHYYVDEVWVRSAANVSCGGTLDTRTRALLLYGDYLAALPLGAQIDVRFDDVYLGTVPRRRHDAANVSVHTPNRQRPACVSCGQCPAPAGAHVTDACAAPLGVCNDANLCVVDGGGGAAASCTSCLPEDSPGNVCACDCACTYTLAGGATGRVACVGHDVPMVARAARRAHARAGMPGAVVIGAALVIALLVALYMAYAGGLFGGGATAGAFAPSGGDAAAAAWRRQRRRVHKIDADDDNVAAMDMRTL